tara:strand:- start:30217 stop:31407 length:1191 start_codon:yes stop_codon:yes gene_type:complete
MKKKLLLLTFAFLSLTITYGQESLDYKTTESYDSFSDSYTLIAKEEYTYYPTGELKMIEYFSWNGSSWEKDNYRDEYNYDANGNLTDNIITTWNVSTSQWENQYKATIEYTNGMITKQTYYNWNVTWVPEDRTDLNYVANMLDTFDGYEWDGSGWVDSTRGTFSFNAGKLSSYTTEEYDTGSWSLTDMNTFTRNGAGKIEEQIHQEDAGSGLQNQDKYSYTLDTNGNRLTETYSSSITNGDPLEFEDRTEYTYDMGEVISSYYHPFNINSFFYDLQLEDFPHYNKVLTSKEYDYNSGWELAFRSTYHYSDDPLGVEEFNLADANVYPNPVNDILNIELKNQTKADVSLFDINGRLILKQKLEDSQTPINIETLHVGIYVLKIQTEHGLAIKRILKS